MAITAKINVKDKDLLGSLRGFFMDRQIGTEHPIARY